MVLCCSPALATDKTWVGGTGWWSYAPSWNPSGTPNNTDNVFLTTADSSNKVVYYFTISPTAVFGNLQIGASTTGSMTLNQGYGGYSQPLASLNEYVGFTGKGTHLQSLGTNTITNSLYLGYGNAAANGTYTLSGTGSLSAPFQYLGYGLNSTAAFTQSTGTTNTANYLYLGLGANSTATYNLTGGSLTTNGTYLGLTGTATGTFIQGGGTHTVNGSLYVGNVANATGVYNLNGGSLSANNEYVGAGASMFGTFTQAGGTNTTQNLTIAGSGGTGTYAFNHGTLNVTNTLNLNTNGYLGIGDGSLTYQTFNQNGGTVTGTLTNNPGSTYNYNSGLFTGRLVNRGNTSFNADFTASDGIENHWRISAYNRNFTLNGNGLDNRGSFTLQNGTLGGNGPVVNSGDLSIMNGFITGSGGFTNAGLFTVNGWVGLSKTGTNVNYGQIAFQSNWDMNQQQQTNPVLNLDNTLINRGLINMANYNFNSAIFIKGGTLTNDVGGIIQGAGIITGNFSNAGAVTVGGVMQIYKDFVNSGLIQFTNYSNVPGVLMGGFTGGVQSGAITNTGTIQGGGTINNNIINNGIINAGGVYGGQLVLNGSVANNATGLMTASEAGIFVTQGMATNAGKITLLGGGFDNNNHPMTNEATGQISGLGTFRTGGTGLLNYGKVNLTGDIGWGSIVVGPVNNGDSTHTSARMDLNSYVYFSGPVVNWGTVKTYGVGTDLGKATLTFAGGYTEHGTYISDPMWQKIVGDLTVGQTGFLFGGKDDKWEVTGNFINNSAKNLVWQTAQSDLAFSNQGSNNHDLYLTGADLGASRQGFENNFAWGSLDITDQQISLVDGNDTQGGLSMRACSWAPSSTATR